MRLLIDEALQQRVADLLGDAGHDAVHAVAVGLQGANDRSVLDRARNEERVAVTTDTDFGMLLALSGEDTPSVVLLRGIDDDADARAAAVVAAVSTVEEQLAQGAVAVISLAAFVFAPCRSVMGRHAHLWLNGHWARDPREIAPRRDNPPPRVSFSDTWRRKRAGQRRSPPPGATGGTAGDELITRGRRLKILPSQLRKTPGQPGVFSFLLLPLGPV